jgi:hypothetical protein
MRNILHVLRSTGRSRWTMVSVVLGLAVLLIDGSAAAGASLKDSREKQPPVGVRLPAESVRATDKPVPLRAKPEPAWRSGVIENGQAPLPASLYRIENQWQGVIGDQHVSVYAGELAHDPGQGILVVQNTPVNHARPATAPQIVHGPAGAGALRILAASGNQLNVLAASGARLTFHLASHQLLPQ